MHTYTTKWRKTERIEAMSLESGCLCLSACKATEMESAHKQWARSEKPGCPSIYKDGWKDTWMTSVVTLSVAALPNAAKASVILGNEEQKYIWQSSPFPACQENVVKALGGASRRARWTLKVLMYLQCKAICIFRPLEQLTWCSVLSNARNCWDVRAWVKGDTHNFHTEDWNLHPIWNQVSLVITWFQP